MKRTVAILVQTSSCKANMRAQAQKQIHSVSVSTQFWGSSMNLFMLHWPPSSFLLFCSYVESGKEAYWHQLCQGLCFAPPSFSASGYEL